jgi:hypothetical protein
MNWKIDIATALSCAEHEIDLLVRTCDANRRSFEETYQWPGVGQIATAPDWSPERVCGQGLHAIHLDMQSNWDLLNWGKGARWLVVAAVKKEIVDLGGKCKFPRALVMYDTGEAHLAAWYIIGRLFP